MCHAQELPNNSTPIPAEKTTEKEAEKLQQPVAESIEIDTDTLQLTKPNDSTKRKPILEYSSFLALQIIKKLTALIILSHFITRQKLFMVTLLLKLVK
ncbi:hypothetical protein JCM19297_1539 [Nonlabens ulvanivorans]|nr:hypothetical protein [Nonlabens ulvanivorans]GAK91588.1 hypothetical protein JCM19297_1539 [Nonlabens ulvanivorans]